MASITNLRILYRMYNAPKSIITLTVRVSLMSRVTIETGKKCVLRRFTCNDYAATAKELINTCRRQESLRMMLGSPTIIIAS